MQLASARNPIRYESGTLNLLPWVPIWVVLWAVLATDATGQSEANGGRGELYKPAAQAERIPHQGPRDWIIVEDKPHLVEPGMRWHVYIEESEAGVAKSGARTTPIRQTRVRIVRVDIDTAEETDLAYIEHESNFEIAIKRPGDPSLNQPVSASNNPGNPWPNPSGFHFVESPRPFDFDENNHNELVLRYYATHAAEIAQGILLLQIDEEGFPTRMPLGAFVQTLRTEDLHLRDIKWSTKRRNPLLVVSNLSLEDCQFLAQLEIPGELNCENCCEFPVYLARQLNGKYAPIYERESQQALLDRLRVDIAVVSGGTELPLSSAEEAALARMASFFYLTGQGERSEDELDRALGERVDHFRVQLLRDRIRAHFLQ